MADAQVNLLLKAKEETAGAFEAVKGRLENIKSILETALVWRAGEMIFEKAAEGAKDFIGSLIGANANVETLRTSLTALYGNAAQAGAAIEYMTKFSLESPFAKDAILQAGQSIASFGQDITKVLPALGNVAAVMGVDLPSAAQALETAINTGRMTGLATTLHITKQELIDFGAQTTSTGTIISSTILPAFEKLAASKQFSGGMTAQLNTFSGATTNLKNQFDNLAEIVGKPIFQVLEKELASLVSFLSAHQGDVNKFAVGLGNAMGAAARDVGSALSFIGSAVATFSNWFTASALPVIETVIGYWIIGLNALAGLFSTGLSGITRAITDKIGGWATAFGAWIGPAYTNLVNNWPKILNGILDKIGSAAGDIGKKLVLWGAEFVGWLVPKLPELTKNFALFQAGLFKMIAETAIILPKKLVEWGIAILTWIGAQIKPWVDALLKLGEDMAVGLAQGLKNKAGDVKDAITGIVMHPLDTLNSLLGRSSPSKVFFAMGVDIGQGLINGLKSMQAPVAEAMKQMAGLPEGLKSGTGPSAAQPTQTAQQIGMQWLADHGLLPSELGGGGKSSDSGLGLSAPNLGVPAIAAATIAALKSPALAGLTGAGSGGAGGGLPTGRVPLGNLGAQFLQVLATGGALHSGTSPAERNQERAAQAAEKSAQQGSDQVNYLKQIADATQASLQRLETMAAAVIKGALPQTPPLNHAQAAGVARPVY